MKIVVGLLISIFIFLIVWGARLESVEITDDMTALMIVAKAGDADAVRSLIKKGADPNERDKTGGTALFYAAANERLEATEALLDHGADVNAEDENGSTAARFNVENKNKSLEVLRLLVSRGLDLNHPDKFGQNVLLNSIGPTTTYEKIEFLVENGAAVNNRSKADGDFPLRRAADEGSAKIVRLLLRFGADPNLRTNDGTTALMTACTYNNKKRETIELLRAAGADASLKNQKGLTAAEMVPENEPEIRALCR